MGIFRKNENLNDKLRDFLKLQISRLCSRCDRTTLPDIDVRLNAETLDPKYWHNDGKINTYLKAKRNVSRKLQPFFNDVEHGLFHGLMTAFISYYFNNRTDQDFCSCLLHDFSRIAKTNVQEHAMDLYELFPLLLNQTYYHTLPNLKAHLVKSDRIELRRFEDYLDWVDDRFTNIVFSDELNLFYDILRPALQTFYENRKEIWIRHGFETYSLADKYPCEYQEIEGGYAIEHDQFPFVDCATHDQVLLYGQIKGYIPLSNFKGKIINSGQRDHLYAQSEILTKDWIFSYHIEEAPFLKIDIPSIVDATKSRQLITEMIGGGIRLVRQDNLYLFGDLIKKLIERITILNS